MHEFVRGRKHKRTSPLVPLFRDTGRSLRVEGASWAGVCRSETHVRNIHLPDQDYAIQIHRLVGATARNDDEAQLQIRAVTRE